MQAVDGVQAVQDRRLDAVRVEHLLAQERQARARAGRSAGLAPSRALVGARGGYDESTVPLKSVWVTVSRQWSLR